MHLEVGTWVRITPTRYTVSHQINGCMGIVADKKFLDCTYSQEPLLYWIWIPRMGGRLGSMWALLNNCSNFMPTETLDCISNMRANND